MNKVAPIEAHLSALMNALASSIDEVFNGKPPAKRKDIGFMLFAWDGSKAPEAGRMNYISNVGSGQREEVVTMLKTMLADAEGRLAKTPKTKQ